MSFLLCLKKEKIETDFIVGKCKKDIQKLEKKIQAIRSVMAKSKYEQTDAELKSKHQQEVSQQVFFFSRLNFK